MKSQSHLKHRKNECVDSKRPPDKLPNVHGTVNVHSSASLGRHSATRLHVLGRRAHEMRIAEGL